MSEPLNVAVLVSGNGSNLQAIIDQWEAGKLPIRLKLVFSNRADAYALERARQHQIPTQVLSHRDFPNREEFDRRVAEILEAEDVELVVLAGFMRLLSDWFVAHWRNRIINLHPSLVPSFTGLEAPKQAFEHGVKVTGCSVFFVDEGLDTGPIIAQTPVPVRSNDTLESLTQRIHQAEHQLLPKVIGWIAEGRVKVVDRRVLTPEE